MSGGVHVRGGTCQGGCMSGGGACQGGYLDLLQAGGDGGTRDHPGVAPPQAGSHLSRHTAGGGHQLSLIQNHPPEPKLQQGAPVMGTSRSGQVSTWSITTVEHQSIRAGRYIERHHSRPFVFLYSFPLFHSNRNTCFQLIAVQFIGAILAQQPSITACFALTWQNICYSWTACLQDSNLVCIHVK